MNSPSSFFKAEQLTPSSSPISLSLDDSRNVNSNSFANLLASPTRFKLSDSNNTNNNINSNGGSSIFPTSLSKLSTYNRGRSNDKSSRDRELRPVSPIRFNNSKDTTTNSSSNKPIMFKQEFISNYSSLPLLSTLLKTSNNINNNNNSKQTSNNNLLNPLLDDNLPKLSIKETLQRIQQYNSNKLQSNDTAKTIPINNKSNNNIPTPVPTQMNIPPPPQQQPKPEHSIQQSSYDIIESNISTTTTTSTNNDNNNNNNNNNQINDSEMLLAPPLELQVRNTVPNNDRIVSNTSTLYTNDMTEQNFMTDNNGFVKYMKNKKVNNPANNVNRYSFISSTSTDYDNFDLYEQPQPQQLPQPRRNISNNSQQNHHHLSDINEFTTRLESSKLDLKIKQLEVEINELKLQNMKLINSLNHQPINYFNEEDEDELLYDELDENIHLKHKVKRLERRIDGYKKSITSNKTNNKVKRNLSVSTNKSNNSHNRISRISTQELQRFEETTDPSSSFSSMYSDDETTPQQTNKDSKILTSQNLQNESGLLECDYEADIDDEHLIHLPKKRGFNLNIPIEK